jgi:hypothetical protein
MAETSLAHSLDHVGGWPSVDAHPVAVDGDRMSSAVVLGIEGALRAGRPHHVADVARPDIQGAAAMLVTVSDVLCSFVLLVARCYMLYLG